MPKESFRLYFPDRLETRDVPAANFANYPILPEYDSETIANVRKIAFVGAINGQRDDAFLKVGDSNTASNDFLFALGSPTYNPVANGLVNYGSDLVETWQNYRQPIDAFGNNSFSHVSESAHGGYSTIQMMSKLDQEISATRASVALVLTGTNDLHLPNNQDLFREYLGDILNRLSSQGIVPILSTIPWDRLYGTQPWDQLVAQYNQIIVDVAEQYRVPVINLWRAVDTLPNNGLKYFDPFIGRDHRHLSSSPDRAGGLTAFDLAYGQNLRTLMTLQTLSQLRHVAFTTPAAVETSGDWVPLQTNQAVFVTGSDLGSSAIVTIQAAETGQVLNRITPFGSSFRGGVNVALGDLNGDQIPDIVTAPGLGGGPVIRVYSGNDGSEIFNFYAFEPNFRGGVTVAVGDANGDGSIEIVVGTGFGGAPRVRVFRNSDLAVTADFFAFDPGFRNGVTVAVGSTDGGWIAAGAGAGGSPTISIFARDTGQLLRSVAAFDPSLRNGVQVGAGDVTGDGRDDLIAGAGVGDHPVVEVLDPINLSLTSSFAVGDPTSFDGVRVAAVRGSQLIATSPGRGLTRGSRLFNADGIERVTELAADRGIEPYSGIYVGG